MHELRRRRWWEVWKITRRSKGVAGPGWRPPAPIPDGAAASGRAVVAYAGKHQAQEQRVTRGAPGSWSTERAGHFPLVTGTAPLLTACWVERTGADRHQAPTRSRYPRPHGPAAAL